MKNVAVRSFVSCIALTGALLLMPVLVVSGRGGQGKGLDPSQLLESRGW